MNESVVGARPDDVDVQVRRPDGINNSAPHRLLPGILVVGGYARRHVVGFAREVGADGIPAAAAVDGLQAIEYPGKGCAGQPVRTTAGRCADDGNCRAAKRSPPRQ